MGVTKVNKKRKATTQTKKGKSLAEKARDELLKKYGR